MKLIRYVLALIVICFMVLLAQLAGTKEIIFPEIAALAIGAWVAEKQPWDVNKRRIFVLMTICSVIGLLITKYAAFPMLIQIALGFSIVSFILFFARTNFVPVISACLLPILLKTDAWIYPLSVAVMSVLIITGQWLMEKYGLKEKNIFIPCEVCQKDELIKWSKLLFLLAFIALLPIHFGKLFIIAPPLVVIFAEFSNRESKLRNFPIKVIDLVGLAAAIQVIMILVLNTYFHVPLLICTFIATVLMFFIFEKEDVLFPPVGAILLLPLLLNKNDLLLYPFEVMLGCALFISAAMFTFKKPVPATHNVKEDSL